MSVNTDEAKSCSLEELNQIWDEITARVDADKARLLLRLFEATGVADAMQLQSVADLSRERFNLLIERMRFHGLVTECPMEIKRPGVRGRSPRVFLLADEGARLLSEWSGKTFHPSGLRQDTSILHALAILDVHSAAVRKGLDVATDQNIEYGDDKHLRPDLLVRGVTGEKIIYEVEQSASPATLRRIKESLEHKQAFFRSTASSGILQEVRMLINLPRGKTWERTLEIWQRAMKVVLEENGKPLAFRLLVLQLAEFLTHPDWEAQAGIYWGEIKIKDEKVVAKEKGSLAIRFPANLQYHTRRDERLVLNALLEYFLKDARRKLEEYPQPDPEFLELVRLIYSASFDPTRPARWRAGLPHASLYLLKQYLNMHPDLLERLNEVLHSAPGSTRWNPTMILHRMQVVIDIFLRYHGWRSNGSLFAASVVSGWEEEDVRTFGARVSIRDAEILMAEDEIVVPSGSDVEETERALEWVLKALFEYSIDLGLGRVEFW